MEKDGRILAPRPPDFLRVRYSSHPTDPSPFSSLVTFNLRPVEINRHNDRLIQLSPLDYTIVAIVRMRFNSQGRDFIKTYIPLGYLVTVKDTHIISRGWSVENKSERFMLVYAQYT